MDVLMCRQSSVVFCICRHIENFSFRICSWLGVTAMFRRVPFKWFVTRLKAYILRIWATAEYGYKEPIYGSVCAIFHVLKEIDMNNSFILYHIFFTLFRIFNDHVKYFFCCAYLCLLFLRQSCDTVYDVRDARLRVVAECRWVEVSALFCWSWSVRNSYMGWCGRIDELHASIQKPTQQTRCNC